MKGAAASIYQEIAERTGGDIYLGVVGPVRTGKSTFVKRVMETLVIPNIQNVYQRARQEDCRGGDASDDRPLQAGRGFVDDERSVRRKNCGGTGEDSGAAGAHRAA